jgi:putative spermidine/putrescine transport system substrate-binding protein
MGGSLDNIMPGLEYFQHLKNIGNFIPVDCYPANIVSGATPIAIVWDYLNLAYRDQYPSIKYSVSIPTTGRYGGFYCQAISKSAPHPNAAKLWQEFVYSDEGQLAFLAGYAHPARYAALAAAGKIPASLSKKLPPASQYAGVRFPTVAQITKASEIVVKNWDSMVGGS